MFLMFVLELIMVLRYDNEEASLQHIACRHRLCESDWRDHGTFRTLHDQLIWERSIGLVDDVQLIEISRPVSRLCPRRTRHSKNIYFERLPEDKKSNNGD